MDALFRAFRKLKFAAASKSLSEDAEEGNATEELISCVIRQHPQRFYADMRCKRIRQVYKAISTHALIGVVAFVLWCLTYRGFCLRALLWWLLLGLVVESFLLLAWPRLWGGRHQDCLDGAQVAMQSSLRCWWGFWMLQVIFGVSVQFRRSSVNTLVVACLVALWPFVSIAIHAADQRDRTEKMRGIAASLLILPTEAERAAHRPPEAACRYYQRSNSFPLTSYCNASFPSSISCSSVHLVGLQPTSSTSLPTLMPPGPGRGILFGDI
eukprot:TRINITY_DN39185_c0_g1_i1.p1 TRINITY_DN39185_c0_g1~~TRINITY_DN39185_c0_g1_i1.p1  ORF type:complete len:291 (+),score=40.34 TRINITY_DN39185_c0_g1_i1:70-873(+)